MKLILFGPPGSGKGTQASLLAKKNNIPHLSTGDILRFKLKQDDNVAQDLSKIISDGNLVPDSIINPIVADKLLSDECKNGFILDGYPRNKYQCDFLINFLEKNNLDIDLIIDFIIDTNTVKKRVLERSKIENRPDDKLEVIKTRLDNYFAETQPLAGIFKIKFKERFLEINAMQEITKIQYDIENRLKNA
jgi:adenylate kinase